MSVANFDAFIEDFLSICKKNYKEYAKQIIREQKKIPFKKSSKGLENKFNS